jgi:hypothetical protein
VGVRFSNFVVRGSLIVYFFVFWELVCCLGYLRYVVFPVPSWSRLLLCRG